MPAPIKVSVLVEHAAALFDVPLDAIKGPCRKPEFFRPRAAIALAAKVGGRSYREIGRQLGGRDHTTIQSACDRAEQFWRRDHDFRSKCLALINLADQHRAAQLERN